VLAPEATHRQRLQILVMADPAGGGGDALREPGNVETQLAGASVHFLLLAGEEIQEQRRDAVAVEVFRDGAVPRAEAAAAAAVREDDDAGGVRRYMKISA
jgi:hypothetical protein